MFERLLLFFVVVSMLWCLVGCECKHEFNEATCTESAICNKCGAIISEALGHDFTEATCTTSAICNRCGAIGDEALGHNYRNGKCINCSAFIPVEDIGFTNTIGYDTWVEIRSYQTDATGEQLKSVELVVSQRYSFWAIGFRLNETYFEDVAIETQNDSTVYTLEERAIINRTNQQITLDDYVRDGFIGHPVITIFERKGFNEKVVMRLDSDDKIKGYYVPLDIIDFSTKREVGESDGSSITYSVEVK